MMAGDDGVVGFEYHYVVRRNGEERSCETLFWGNLASFSKYASESWEPETILLRVDKAVPLIRKEDRKMEPGVRYLLDGIVSDIEGAVTDMGRSNAARRALLVLRHILKP
jgi:hypothetical protein